MGVMELASCIQAPHNGLMTCYNIQVKVMPTDTSDSSSPNELVAGGLWEANDHFGSQFARGLKQQLSPN